MWDIGQRRVQTAGAQAPPPTPWGPRRPRDPIGAPAPGTRAYCPTLRAGINSPARMSPSPQARPPAFEWRLYVPKLVTVLKEGYGLGDLREIGRAHV